MKNIIFFIVCSLFLEISSFCQSNDLHLKINLSKNVYLKGEQIYLNNYLINNSSNLIKTRKLKPADFYYKVLIKNSTGTIFLYLNTLQYFRDTTLSLQLQPGDSSHQILELIGNYLNVKPRWTAITTTCSFPTDKYYIYTTLETGYGIITSNQLSFDVVEPAGEDLEAYNVLELATEYFIKRDFKKSCSTLFLLSDKYPNSVYRVVALRQIMTMYTYSDNYDDQKEAYNAAMKLIESYPTSEAADLALTHILTRTDKIIKTKADRKNILLEIEKKYPNTIIGKRSKKTIQDYETN